MDDLSPQQLAAEVHQALKHWHNVDEKSQHHLGQLLLVQQERAAIGLVNPTTQRLATNRVLERGLEQLELREPELTLILKRRFVEKVKIKTLSQQLHISEDTVKRKQRTGLGLLAEILYELELQKRAEQIDRLTGGLESPSYSALFGIEAMAEKVKQQLTISQRQEVVMLTGLGGIGKTSLANYVIRQIIPHFLYEAVVWVSIQQVDEEAQTVKQRHELLIRQIVKTVLPLLSSSMRPEIQLESLRQLLKEIPHLIIIDNLELKGDTSFLLSNLVALSSPSKFLLTSRSQPNGQSGVLMHTLNELPFSASAELIRHHANELGLHDLGEAKDEALRPIYKTVGGNPFALKLLVGLCRVQSLPLVLRDLQAKGSAELFKKIFWQAWQALSEPAQKLLTVMPLSAHDGITGEQLERDELVDEAQLWAALSELVSYSLVEVRGTVWERRYYIHQLTEMFIRSEIL